MTESASGSEQANPDWLPERAGWAYIAACPPGISLESAKFCMAARKGLELVQMMHSCIWRENGTAFSELPFRHQIYIFL